MIISTKMSLHFLNHTVYGRNKDKDPLQDYLENKNESKKSKEDKESDDEQVVQNIEFLISVIKQNIVEDGLDYMDPVSIKASRRQRLRSCVKRNNKDIMLRWIKIGCGSCFIHEQSGRTYEVGPADNEEELPPLLREMMFMYYIDCKLPYNPGIVNIEHDEEQKGNEDVLCNLCGKYMIEPTDVNTLINFKDNMKFSRHRNVDKQEKCQKNHKFCKKCIIGWQQLIDNPEYGNMHVPHSKTVNLEDTIVAKFGDRNKAKRMKCDYEIFLPERCPGYLECFSGKLESNTELVMAMEDRIEPGDQDKRKLHDFIKLPICIQEQLMNENNSRYDRLYLMNKYYIKRELEFLIDQDATEIIEGLIENRQRPKEEKTEIIQREKHMIVLGNWIRKFEENNANTNKWIGDSIHMLLQYYI